MSLAVFTDEVLFKQTGIRIAFTSRVGGVSEEPYRSLNLGSHVNDDLQSVGTNRKLVLEAFGTETCPLIIPNQVHGDTIVEIASANSVDLAKVQEAASLGADALIVETCDVAALLCYADCVPVIIVGPDKSVAVAHAGWRGVDNRICIQVLSQMASRAPLYSTRDYCESTNIYIGAYIHSECFEVSKDLADHFEQSFGSTCRLDERHIDLGQALRIQLLGAGIKEERIADLNICTVCNTDLFFSYRAEGGVTGRHGAFAIKKSH